SERLLRADVPQGVPQVVRQAQDAAGRRYPVRLTGGTARSGRLLLRELRKNAVQALRRDQAQTDAFGPAHQSVVGGADGSAELVRQQDHVQVLGRIEQASAQSLPVAVAKASDGLLYAAWLYFAHRFLRHAQPFVDAAAHVFDQLVQVTARHGDFVAPGGFEM